MTTAPFPAEVRKLVAKRKDRYRLYLDFFNGTQWPRRRRTDPRRLTVNYARTIVHKTAAHVAFSQLQMVPPAAEGGPSEEAQARAEQAEQVLQDVAYANDLQRLDYEAEVDCAVLGDGAFKVTYQRDVGVVVTAPDVAGIYVWTEPHDRRRYWQLAECYERDGVKVTERWTGELWEVYEGDQLVMSQVNPYGFIPYVVYPNEPVPKSFWGQSDLEVLMDPLRELNRELSVLSLIMEFSGNPITVLSGVDNSEDLESVPGAIWEMPEDAKAYLLDLLAGGGVQLHKDYLDAIYQTIHDLGEIPRAAFAGVSRDLSGVALEIELRPLIQKVERKRIIRHWAYARRGLMALALVDRFEASDHAGAGILSVGESNPVLPRDADADVAREQLGITAGVSSRQSAMRRLGTDDPAAEWEQYLEEQRQLAEVTPAPPPSVDGVGARV